MTTMTLSDLWSHFRLLQSAEGFSEAERIVLDRSLREEHRCRERRRIEYLMKISGIGRPKLLDDFDRSFNPKIPRDKIMEFVQTDFLKNPSNLVLGGWPNPTTRIVFRSGAAPLPGRARLRCPDQGAGRCFLPDHLQADRSPNDGRHDQLDSFPVGKNLRTGHGLGHPRTAQLEWPVHHLRGEVLSE